ncbi:unnamed protein product [Triticum turgidum subsp. durum]|uniref:Disease resistance protein At4g27190-like leucine-rich repeats domain-containing protein n=1 Tax=Triticum turgidum subsp. durum TaxID=4567 RepID=A0A9R1PCB1_TRITD|nr:unnamed protein product [Triticum turgidum subsp. durum]
MPPEKIKIQAKNIDAAAGEIVDVLEDARKGNVIYFKGWRGLGASTVLNLVAQRLKSSTRSSKFDKVIHVDCSAWKSMRSLQKAVAEELELPQSVMAIFDQYDKDDDFNGKDEGSREVIADIRIEIFRKLYNSRFLVVFHNGSNRYIDLYECGVPVISLLGNKVLWTWHGRFRMILRLEDGEKVKMKSQTDVRLSASPESEVEVLDILHEEALDVAKCTGIVQPDDMSHKIVMECLIYRALIATDLKAHAPNYWICDGIIQGQDNASAWDIGNSLHRNMCLDSPVIGSDEAAAFLLHVLNDSHVNRWNFTTHKELRNDKTHVLPPQVTSFFLSADEPPTNTTSILPVGMFQHSQSSKLRVLHLSHCTFSFASPPFVHCAQLRLLHLDHCTNITDDDEHPSHNEDMSCFQKLWVMDLRYTEWYWLLSEMMKRLMVDLRELNVEGVKHGSISDLCGGRPSLVVLRVTVADPVPMENEDTTNQAHFPNMSSTNSLTTSSFINDVLPPWLESFSFINIAATAANISSISFRGCSRLKSILLKGNLGSLQELDLSGTAVKTLDLREVEAPNFKRVMLLGCEKLHAILWPAYDEMVWDLEKLHISTVQSASPNQNNWEEKTKEASVAGGSSSILGFGESQLGTGRIASFDFNWYISVVDPRLMWSLLPFQQEIKRNFVYMEIDSSPASGAAVGGGEVTQGIGSQQQFAQYLYASDVFQEEPQAISTIEGVISWMWACPPTATPLPQDWYFHMQDEEKMERGSLQQQYNARRIDTGVALAPVFMCDNARMLYVHDSYSTTCIPCPQGATWRNLIWCRVERCPKLCSVFATPQLRSGEHTFFWLSTLWASQLPMACYIWNWSTTYQPSGRSFEDLVLLHLDYCPRLIHVLPLSEHMDILPSLETLEIVCCGDLKEVFPLDPKRQQKREIIRFPTLRHIHLYQLSTLQGICGSRMSAPNLETIKIRGCWGLSRLPAVSGSARKRPKVDCEKDLWDNLKWDGLEAKHDPSLYETRHSRYYKKAHLPRGTVLR